MFIRVPFLCLFVCLWDLFSIVHTKAAISNLSSILGDLPSTLTYNIQDGKLTIDATQAANTEAVDMSLPILLPMTGCLSNPPKNVCPPLGWRVRWRCGKVEISTIQISQLLEFGFNMDHCDANQFVWWMVFLLGFPQ